MSMLVSNAAGAYGRVGIENNGRIVFPRLTSGAVSAGDVVVLDALTDTGTDANVIITVHSADVGSDDAASVLGVALHDAASGDVVEVVEYGPAIVNVGDATIAAGNRATFHASTDGAADGATSDATTVEGDTFGVYLSANDVPTTNVAVLFVGR